MWKSASASPGARATFRTTPIRRSELMNVPSFSPQAGRGQHEVSELRRFRRVVHVLNDEKVEPLEHVAGHALVDPRMSGVRGDDPQAANFAAQNAFQNAMVRPACFVRDRCLVDVEHVGHFAAIDRIREVVPAEQIRRVAEQPRAHRVALAGDRVGAGAGPADVAGHQRQVDDRLGGAHGLMALVDAHRPPERNSFALVNRAGKLLDRLGRQPRFFGNAIEREVLRRTPRTRRSRSCERR